VATYFPIEVDFVYEGTPALTELRDHAGTLTLKLTDRKEKLFEVQFDEYVAYRKYSEGDAHRTLVKLLENGNATKLVYDVQHSEFLSWLNAESSDFYGSGRTRTIHTLIAALDDMIDVISLSPAKFATAHTEKEDS
jgi:hypothetical protein